MSILIGINIDLLLLRCIVRFGDGQLQLPVYTLNIYQSLGVGVLLVGICSQILGWSQRYLRGSRLLLIFAQILHDIDNFPIRGCGWGDFPGGILDFLFYFLSLTHSLLKWLFILPGVTYEDTPTYWDEWWRWLSPDCYNYWETNMINISY